MAREKRKKKLYVFTVNGENSWFNKKADTFVRAYSVASAKNLVKRRYLKTHGKADVTEVFIVDEENKKIMKTFLEQ